MIRKPNRRSHTHSGKAVNCGKCSRVKRKRQPSKERREVQQLADKAHEVFNL